VPYEPSDLCLLETEVKGSFLLAMEGWNDEKI
jgi:hypothetical protein